MPSPIIWRRLRSTRSWHSTVRHSGRRSENVSHARCPRALRRHRPFRGSGHQGRFIRTAVCGGPRRHQRAHAVWFNATRFPAGNGSGASAHTSGERLHDRRRMDSAGTESRLVDLEDRGGRAGEGIGTVEHERSGHAHRSNVTDSLGRFRQRSVGLLRVAARRHLSSGLRPPGIRRYRGHTHFNCEAHQLRGSCEEAFFVRRYALHVDCASNQQRSTDYLRDLLERIAASNQCG